MNRNLFILIASVFMTLSAHAQWYAGAGVGYGKTDDNRPTQISIPHLEEQQTVKSATVGAFVGYRFDRFAIEGGMVTLPKMKGTSSTDDYWAYKGVTSGPRTISLNQTIKGESFYLRGNVYAGLAYAFAGMAYTKTRNREWGVYDGTDAVDYKDTYTTVRPVFGLGVQGKGIRLEYLRINKASDEYHVRVRDVGMVMLSGVYKF